MMALSPVEYKRAGPTLMEIGASASSIFGSASGADILSVGVSAGVTPAQEAAQSTITAHQREINRIRGYKLQLTVAEKQKLAGLQVEIQEITQRVNQGIARLDELDTRTELYNEADRIIGKPIIDADADEELAELAGGLDALLEPKLDRARAKQVERLERYQDTLESRLTENPENRTVLQQLQSVSRLIAQQKPLRSVSELTPAEARAYDELVELVNERAGAKVELTVKEAKRVEELQRSISDLEALQPADIAQQPTPGQVARAYARLL